MHKKTRRVIFYVAVFVFIIISSLIVAYSWGYRFDKEKRELVLTGGLYLKTNVSKPQIYLDGEFLENATPGLLNSGIFLSNLLPDIHQIEVKKNNYFSWQKNVEVKSQMVTTFFSVVLLPQNPLITDIYKIATITTETTTPKIITEDVVDFLPLNNNKEIIVQIKESATTTNAILKIHNYLNKNTNSSSNSDVEIYRQKLAKKENLNLIPNLKINDSDGNEIIFDLTKNKIKTYYLWQRINPENLINLSSEIADTFKLKNPIQKIVFYPNIENKYIVLSGKDLYFIDFDKNEAIKKVTNVLDFFIRDYSLFWLDYNGSVFGYNLILDNSTPLGIIELKKDIAIKKADISHSNQIALLFDDNVLYLFKAGEDIEKKENVFNFSFSPDNRKLAYINDKNELRVEFLTDINSGDVLRKKGDNILITKTKNSNEKIGWYSDSEHLIIQSGSKIYFAEIDDRDKINIFEENFDFDNFLLTSNKNGTIWGISSKLIQKIDLLYENII
ncbi:MAG: hypothetical protein GX873_01005 [Parcubacteria group bacterium]|nr:hypothetical protein [Parcubacteria group bacterium]